ncbi:LGFP repeat-containing protein [Cytobacillus firmus]|uniref:LGFP repeat-containing protein n=1 Tax=Cytobacillus firmus TaxID=1399 RepID=UPI0018CF7897|nr:hypothetical protein [Cytobacillus firmus]
MVMSIQSKYEQYGGANGFLGAPTTHENVTPDGIGRFRHFQGGSIYWNPNTGAQLIHGAIRDKWAELGFERSWLGFPISDEENFTEGGRVSVFQNGEIYWWPDVGAIELREVVVHYTGMYCFGETDWDQGSNEDEPYAIVGIVVPPPIKQPEPFRSRIYEDINDHTSMRDIKEIYRGKPCGMNISFLVMEHDLANPDKYKGSMTAACYNVAIGLTAAIGVIPKAGPFLATVAGPALIAAVPDMANELNNIFDFGDDRIGHKIIHVSAKQMVVLAARTRTSEFEGIPYKLESPLLSGEGASYKVYIGLAPV